ncbi:MAG: response regulator [Fuerstiella sp.]
MMQDKQIQVLLLDDDTRILRSLARQLEEEDFEVMTTVSAAEASAILNRQRFDAIVCDNEMPGRSGVQFLSQIRHEYPDMVRFMLTGSILEHNAQRAMAELGVIKVLPKPCKAADVADSIREAMHASQKP